MSSKIIRIKVGGKWKNIPWDGSFTAERRIKTLCECSRCQPDLKTGEQQQEYEYKICKDCGVGYSEGTCECDVEEEPLGGEA